MLRSQLSMWCYTPNSSFYPGFVADYGDVVEGLEFTSVAPGGFGDLACIVKLPYPRIPRPELGLFSRVVLRDGPYTAFAGEWVDPALVLDGQLGEYVLLSALGGGVALRDDPADSSYSANTTAQAIIANEFSTRSNYLALDADQSLVFPNAPATTFTPVYDGWNLEEIVSDLCQGLGDYTWGVWDHATNRDGSNFPTWQLQAHLRDVATTTYMALGDDIVRWHVSPSAERAFNVFEVLFVDQSGGPGTVTVSDPRLSVGGGQGSAPFRRRKKRLSLGRMPLTSAQATIIANAMLASYKDVTNKVEIELASVRDANGVRIPLSHVRADGNLFIPELAQRGALLSTGPNPGVNQFYVVEARWRETKSTGERLILQLDNFADKSATALARLRIAADAESRARSNATYRPVVPAGAVLSGPAGAAFPNSVAGSSPMIFVTFPAIMVNVPSNVVLSNTVFTNGSNARVSSISKTGFRLLWDTTANGLTQCTTTYTTVP